MSRHHGRHRGNFYGCAYNWKRGPAVCRNNLHLPQAVLETAVLEAVATQLDADVVAAAVAEARRRLEESARHRAERRLALEHELRLVRAREQRLAEAIAHGREPDRTPDAVLDALRTEQARRIALEADIAHMREPVAGSPQEATAGSPAPAPRGGCPQPAAPAASARTHGAPRAPRRSNDLYAIRHGRDPRVPVCRPRVLRRPARRHDVAHYHWWPQRDSNPCLLSATRFLNPID